MNLSSYTFGKTVAMNFTAAIDAVTRELAKEGFGVLTEIDVAATMKKKLNFDMPPYKILGACNPQFAREAITVEPQIGALLPCNVVVRIDADGRTRVEFMDPNAVLKLVDRPEVGVLGAEVRQRLQRVMDAMPSY
jgi:uncharacterized protein (DUF302 family)